MSINFKEAILSVSVYYTLGICQEAKASEYTVLPLKTLLELVHIFSIWKTEAGGLQVQGQPGLQSKTLSQKQNNNNKNKQ